MRTLSILSLLLVLPGCKGQFQGTVYFGPEAMFFVPCGEETRYWLETESFDAPGWDKAQRVLNAQPECSLSTMPCKMQRVDIRARASFGFIGDYGHLDQYDRSITLRHVSAAGEAAQCGT